LNLIGDSVKNGLHTDKSGTKYWYLDNKLHREDGPAVEWNDGELWWYLNGGFHREDGPAIVRLDSNNVWFLNNRELTEEEFSGYLRNKQFNDSINEALK